MRVFLLLLSLLSTTCFAAPFTLKDQATFYGPTSESFSLCWSLDQTSSNATRVDMRRTRSEGGIGAVEAIVAIQRAQWTADGAGWCAVAPKLKKSGHFVYEIRVCTNVCSPWASSLTHGSVQGQAKAWWQYGYLAPPGSVTPL